MLEGRDVVRLSKYLSRILRHRPEEAGIVLDARGFAPIDDLLAAARRALGPGVERADLEALATTPDDPSKKLRYEIDGDRMRAGHGHSVEVSGYRATRPSASLYHATVSVAVPAIRAEGLRAMARRMVHLSYDRDITFEAARRRGPDVVLVEVDVEAAVAAGVEFYESADPRIVLAEAVPAGCLRFVEGPRR